MVATALLNQLQSLTALRSTILDTRSILDPTETNLWPSQALLLAAVVLDRRPDVILDLGTGSGGSSAAMAVAAGHNRHGTVETFDLTDRWGNEIAPKLAAVDRSRWAPVRQHAGDLTQFDYATLLKNARSALVFWDAHGFEVADAVLGRIMPVIADLSHVVICHDVVDNRFPGPTTARSYGGKRSWRGMADWYDNSDTTNCLNIGWCNTLMDQILPILDFCFRNEIELRSADFTIRKSPWWNNVAATLAIAPDDLFNMAYFSLEGTSAREFPPLRPAAANDGLPPSRPLAYRTVAENRAVVTPLTLGAVKVALPTTPWTYVARLVPEQPLPSGAGILTVRMKVASGTAAVGVLNKDGSDFIARRVVRATPEPVEVPLKLAEWQAAGSIVLQTAEDRKGGDVVVQSLSFASLGIA
ncbi:MAG TPA: hypothetical protein VK438_03920 [Xanthobacteraceae bacterium]|nr:hypothetical protein [Xanthobacteraceae bacterium]